MIDRMNLPDPHSKGQYFSPQIPVDASVHTSECSPAWGHGASIQIRWAAWKNLFHLWHPKVHYSDDEHRNQRIPWNSFFSRKSRPTTSKTWSSLVSLSSSVLSVLMFVNFLAAATIAEHLSAWILMQFLLFKPFSCRLAFISATVTSDLALGTIVNSII